MEAGVPPAAPPAAAVTADYPIRYNVEYKEPLGRLSTLFRIILVIPQHIVLIFLGIALLFTAIISWFAIVFTARYPRGLFNFNAMVYRWGINVASYMYLFRDEYPPFSGDAGRYSGVSLEIDYPDHPLSRLTTFFRYFMVIPQQIVLYFVNLLYILVVIVWFAIVFTGRYPRGLFDLLVGVTRWNARVNGYYLMFTDKYPPFSMN